MCLYFLNFGIGHYISNDLREMGTLILEAALLKLSSFCEGVYLKGKNLFPLGADSVLSK